MLKLRATERAGSLNVFYRADRERRDRVTTTLILGRMFIFIIHQERQLGAPRDRETFLKRFQK